MPQHLLERSIASSDKLPWKHAPNIFTSGGCSDCDIWFVAQALFICHDIVEYMLGKGLTLGTLAAAIVLLFLLQVTNPTSSGPAGILAVFFLLYVVIFGVFVRLLQGGSWLVVRLSEHMHLRRPIKQLSLVRSIYIASITAMAPVILMAMSSIGKMGFYEVLLVMAFVTLGVFYVEKRFA